MADLLRARCVGIYADDMIVLVKQVSISVVDNIFSGYKNYIFIVTYFAAKSVSKSVERKEIVIYIISEIVFFLQSFELSQIKGLICKFAFTEDIMLFFIIGCNNIYFFGGGDLLPLFVDTCDFAPPTSDRGCVKGKMFFTVQFLEIVYTNVNRINSKIAVIYNLDLSNYDYTRNFEPCV